MWLSDLKKNGNSQYVEVGNRGAGEMAQRLRALIPELMAHNSSYSGSDALI